MKRLLIPFIAAFGLSLGGATGYVMVTSPKDAPRSAEAKEPKAPPRATSAVQKADSTQSGAVASTPRVATPDTAAAAQPGTSGSNVAVAAANAPGNAPASSPSVNDATQASEPAASAATTSTTTGASGARDVAAAPAAHATPHATPEPQSVSDTVTQHRIARIFAAMQAKDAARVLTHLEDGDVRVILDGLSNKQQAAILESFPAERAASITHMSLRGLGGGR